MSTDAAVPASTATRGHPTGADLPGEAGRPGYSTGGTVLPEVPA